MPRKGQFLVHREDPHTDAMLALFLRVAWQDERGLRQVGLARQRLHFGLGQAARISEDGEHIALKCALCKDIHLRPLEPAYCSTGR